MRLATFRLSASEVYRPRAGLVVGDSVVDVRGGAAELGLGRVPGTATALISAGQPSLDAARRLAELASSPDAAGKLRGAGLLFPLSEVRLLAPLGRPRKNVFAVGRNYAAHVAEGARLRGDAFALPEFPHFFTKAPTSIVGPFDPIRVDLSITETWDWEAELGVVIGKRTSNVPPERAMESVFGYCCINDVTARAIQRRYTQWFKGKSMDDSSPMGPWIVTADEFGDPRTVRLTTRVNGVVKQDDSTANLIFGIEVLLHHLSLGMTLEPGDIVATGTPEGVGQSRVPPEFLRPGDLLETEIERIGVMRNPVVEA